MSAPHLTRIMAEAEGMTDEELYAAFKAIPIPTLIAEEDALKGEQVQAYLVVRRRWRAYRRRRMDKALKELEEAWQQASLAQAAEQNTFQGLAHAPPTFAAYPPPAHLGYGMPSLAPPVAWVLPPVGTVDFVKFTLAPMATVPPTLRHAHLSARAVQRLRLGHTPQVVHKAFVDEMGLALGLP
ncbi:unnamed protein product [Vitrella brassicaformis CCMP3155]|uniref:Uncharacterized protein n=1 Tax=Vitrella brassicaformis (strain CCMP3155) TaxID=1169540 RepID=A0A0G4ECV9_VITBC|nr:unnamed protein product [Vitrella brassicaformis CCMP3155]|mmetsp:Transcript_47773/g.119504  ORF Transcript_47773/g.119504 Transcript_47773/m.119504 type:complete len:183 (-) Transcript_47773:388-936(-)|eukprot:CEL93157.1 unnamed protein product [Vitrella brassicaformis CCMP3155]